MPKDLNCADLRKHFQSGAALSTLPGAEEHLQDCPACAAVYAPDSEELRLEWTEPGATLGDLDALRGQLASRVGTTGGLREWSTKKRTIWLVTVGAAALAWALFRHRPDLSSTSMTRLLLVAAVLGTIGVAGALTLIRPLYRPPPRFSEALWVSLGLVVIPAIAIWPEPDVTALAGADVGGTAFWGRVGNCLGFGTSLAAPLAGLLLLLERGRLTVGRVLAVATVTAAAVGNLVLYLHCPITDHEHRVLGHATLLVSFTALLWLARWVILRVSDDKDRWQSLRP